jgi:phenylacetate-CoA ligase
MTVSNLWYRGVQRLRRVRTHRILEEIRAADAASPELVKKDQLRLLNNLLKHAEQNVPYYRRVFGDLGVTSGDIHTLEDFRQLPVLTKDLVREHKHELVRDDVPIQSLSVHHSGGSTGVPLTFYRDRRYMEMSDAGVARNMERAGWKPGEMVAFFWGFNDRLNKMGRPQFELRQRLRRMYQFDPFNSGTADMDRWLRTWRSIKPRAVLGYASTVARFAAHVEQTGTVIAPVKGVFTTAEKLYAPQREQIERTFQCRVFDLYGSSEVQNIAAECLSGSMHVNADFVVVECDSGPQQSAAGQLIVTSLWNYAMPFIRYRNEDQGFLLPDTPCGCGSNFPLMELRIARETDNFILPNGRVVHGEFFTHLLYGSDGIDSFQFHQTEAGHIRLLIRPQPRAKASRDLAVRNAVEAVQSLHPAIHVSVCEVAAIPLSVAGKHRFTRSDVVIRRGDR